MDPISIMLMNGNHAGIAQFCRNKAKDAFDTGFAAGENRTKLKVSDAIGGFQHTKLI
jgi:hypothetical protein